jgi:uncharacterized protein involved in response to NO
VQPATSPPHRTRPLWGRGFRPFFLGAAIHAALVVPLWTAIWLGVLPAPGWLAPTWWHAHEMLFGTVAAAIAGFLLTASPVWAARPALAGRGLFALAGLWAAGRLGMLAAGGLPVGLVAAVDLAFLPAVALVLARTLWGRAQRRNHGIVVVVAALALANAAVHAEALGLASGWAPRALRLAVDGVVVLIVVIGGRITPAFTANALRRAGFAGEVSSAPWLDRLAIASVVGVALLDLVAPRSAATGVVACAAGVAVAARMRGWQTRRTGGDPLVWSLHAGLAWVAIGLLLVGAGDLGNPVLATAGLHALTAGAMGAMILAVMTRVGLGHTGRPLVLPRGALGAYVLVHAGAAARVASVLVPGHHAPLLALAGALWAGAFALFAVVYAPILTRPRVDGKPG